MSALTRQKCWLRLYVYKTKVDDATVTQSQNSYKTTDINTHWSA